MPNILHKINLTEECKMEKMTFFGNIFYIYGFIKNHSSNSFIV